VLSCDSNILFPPFAEDHADCARARSWLAQHAENEAFVVCELALVEVYMLLRNPTLSNHPFSPAEAVSRIQTLRAHPRWRLVDYRGQLMDELWSLAAQPGFAFRRIIDARLALTLRHYGVTEFATANVKHFRDFGFRRVWNPLVEE
jgi:uncharacterized protein